MNIIYTVCNRTNLTHALALADSVSKFQPDTSFFLCWADPLPLRNLPQKIQILPVTEIKFPFTQNSKWFDFEILAASRPWFALEILKRNNQCSQLTFLAPSVQVYRAFSEIIEQEDKVYLTPHLLKPLAKSAILDDKRILNIGMYHAGSWSLKRTGETLSTLEWWAARTRDRARFDLCEGMNMDQLWLNYVPVWIPETRKILQPGWHYGLHSILNKKLSETNGQLLADRQPLYTVDFAGLTYFDPVWSDHIALAGESSIFSRLLNSYREKLKSFEKYVPAGEQPIFGKKPDIKPNRILRNQIARKLQKLSDYIDQF